MDRGAWWALVHKVAKSQTRLKLLSTHAHICMCTTDSLCWTPEANMTLWIKFTLVKIKETKQNKTKQMSFENSPCSLICRLLLVTLVVTVKGVVTWDLGLDLDQTSCRLCCALCWQQGGNRRKILPSCPTSPIHPFISSHCQYSPLFSKHRNHLCVCVLILENSLRGAEDLVKSLLLCKALGHRCAFSDSEHSGEVHGQKGGPILCFWARGSLKKGSLNVRLQPLAEETIYWCGSQGPPQGIPVLVEQERGWWVRPQP